MADKCFRVLLDVTDLNLESYKYVWLNVSPRELKTIFDLKKYILSRLNLKQDVQLFVQYGLLLDEETIVILRDGDTVKIKYKIPACSIPVKESVTLNANISLKRNINESTISEEDINSKRCKPKITIVSENDHHFAEKKSKKCQTKHTEFSVTSENVCCTSAEEKKIKNKSPLNFENSVTNTVEKKKRQKRSAINSDDICSISLEKEEKQTESSIKFENLNSSSVEENQSIQLKYKKKKSPVCDVTDYYYKIFNSISFVNGECPPKKQNIDKSLKCTLLESERSPLISTLSNDSSKEEFNVQQNESSVVVTDITHEEFNNQSKKKRKRRRKRKNLACSETNSCDITKNDEPFSEKINGSGNKNHILYLSPEKNEKSNSWNDTNEFYPSPSGTVVLKENKLSDICLLDYPKMSTPAQSSICGVPDQEFSIPIANKISNLPFKENGSVLQGKSTKKSTTPKSSKEKSGKQLYKDHDSLTSLPLVGTCIAYKALELDENYSPTVTDYREGIIEKINPVTEELEIRLNKEIILPGKTGKFENLGKDEVPQPIVKKYDVLKWCDIISPKKLY